MAVAGAADCYFVGVLAVGGRLLLGGFVCPRFVARQGHLGMSC